MDIKKKMHSGEIYFPGDEELMKEQLSYLDRLYEFNMTRPVEQEKRTAMLKEMFAEIGEDCYIEPPLHANFGGRHVHFGKNVYANFPIHIGKNCWIGAGAVIVPGITIGDNVVIGAGSIVTKDIPSNVIAAGNPCKILREVSEHDRKYYFKNREIDYSDL